MAKSRREKTLADYVVIAISPALIMTLVGSLVFFLLELSYRGDFELRVRWIMFWFVLGAVLVARIAIQEGRDHANLFGGALILVVGVTVFTFVDALNAVLIAWILLAVVWWCSWKLTWDCTLIDDDEDASGEGLLEAAGLSEAAASIIGQEDRAGPLPIDKRAVPDTVASIPIEKPASRSRTHAPGRWVVYFSLAALPIFGVGQMFIPAANDSDRTFAFQLLTVYVASGLGLLLTTSFLGLRRYLRQRKLQMPMGITGTWIGMGTSLVAVLLLLAMLIPRPQGEFTVTRLVDTIDAKLCQASQFAVLPGDRAKGEGRRIGEQDQNERQPGEGQPRQGQQPGEKQNGQAQGDGKGRGENREGNQQGAAGKDGKAQQGEKSEPGEKDGRDRKEEENDRGKPGDKTGQRQQRQAAANPPPAVSSTTHLLAQLAPLVKWILYGIMAAVVLYFVARYWSRLVDILQKLWAEFWSLFGIKPKPESSVAEQQSPVVRRLPFAAYEDPFFSGAAGRMSPEELVQYTFEALEAWAREQVIERPADQTPLEFAQELGRRIPALAKDVAQTAQIYDRIAYARQSPSKNSLEVLERMWRRMHVSARA